MLDRTVTDLVEINVHRKLFWGAKSELLLLGKHPGGFRLLARLKRDWMCDETNREKNSQDGALNPGRREVTLTVGDRDGSLNEALRRCEVAELRVPRQPVRRFVIKVRNEPLDVRRIWKLQGSYNSQETTPIVA